MSKKNISLERVVAIVLATLMFLSILSLPLIFLTSCSSNSTTETNIESDQTNVTQVAVKGGNVVIASQQEPDSLDPREAIAAGTKEILFNVYEGLVKLSPEAEIVPQLAESFNVSEDGLLYSFKLRSNVFYHDGTQLMPQDVVDNLKSYLNFNSKEATKNSIENNVVSISLNENDKNIVEIQLNTANPDFLASMTFPIVKLGNEDLHSKSLGTGPFFISSYSPQRSVILERFEQYNGKDQPYLDRVEFRIVPDSDAAWLELKSGSIDIFPYLTASKITALGDDFKISHASANMVQLLAMNLDDPILKNPKVREAVSLAIDRSVLISLVGKGYGQPLYSAMSPAMKKYYNSELTQSQNLATARELLSEAGYASGLTLTLSVPSNYVYHVDSANVIKAQLAEVGINLDLKSVDWGTWLSEIYMGRKYQMTIIALTFDNFTPTSVLNRYRSDSEQNFINYKNEDFDKALDAALLENKEDDRIQAVKELQKKLLDDVASVFLQDPESITAISKKIDGYVQYPAYIQDLSKVYYHSTDDVTQSFNR